MQTADVSFILSSLCLLKIKIRSPDMHGHTPILPQIPGCVIPAEDATCLAHIYPVSHSWLPNAFLSFCKPWPSRDVSTEMLCVSAYWSLINSTRAVYYHCEFRPNWKCQMCSLLLVAPHTQSITWKSCPLCQALEDRGASRKMVQTVKSCCVFGRHRLL